MFENRLDAARQLAQKLGHYRAQHPLILAIPRGAVPMGRELARLLDGELDVVLVAKLRAPGQPELALGAVDESGWTYITVPAAAMGLDAHAFEAERARRLDLLPQRRAQYTPVRAPIDPAGRVVIVLDDGLATGATMVTALHSVRQRHPARLICAVPVAAPDALARVSASADATVCLLCPDDFSAVGQFYRDFAQVDDAEVVQALATA